MDGRGLLWRRGPPGSNGPHRFIGDRDVSQSLIIYAHESGPKLSFNDGFGVFAITFLERFSHTQNRPESMSEGCQNFPVRPRILLPKVLATFRMTNKDELAAKVLQHGA